MRHLCATLLFLLATCSRAQLVNGSFESDGVFSLEGWEWTCDEPTAVSDAPAGCGDWAVRLNMGDPDCSPSYLFQRIPFAESGEHWTLGGWARIDTVGWDAIALMGFSSINNGMLAFQSEIGNPAPYWSYVWIADTVHASASDTAVVMLTSGTGFMGAGWFDGLELEPADPTGMPATRVDLHTYLDAEQTLSVCAREHDIRQVQLFDAAGSRQHAPVRACAPGCAAIGTDALVPGVYLVRADTDAGPAVARFVKH